VKAPTGPSQPQTVAKTEKDVDVKMGNNAASTGDKPADMDDETWEIMKMMGFAGFKSTKNTKVPGNDRNYGVRRDKTMEARQYMNRQGGFNRPLSPGR
jgi:U4/U6.U5 tri-snRNP-associated protein 3